MSILRSFAFTLITICLSVTAAVADTVRLKTHADGQIRFDVSISGPTRISVVGDRIAKVLQSESAFEMVNDESTGDVFLRFAGGEAQRESGYIVTESGVTIGFVMTPKNDIDMQTVLVTVSGTRGAASQSAKPSGFAVNAAHRGNTGKTTISAEAPQTRTDRLVDFVRKVHARRIGDRSPARLRRGVHASYSSGSLRAKVAVAQAPAGKPPHPMSLSRSKRTIAVWVGDRVVNDKVWIIIVEGRI